MSDARASRHDWIVLAVVCGFLFFYGLGAFGLVGADEPRYAQVAREMLERHDWITPTLGHQPWLEKPVLLYWEQMVSFQIFGISDWAARIPSAFSATLLIAAIYLFLRRFRPGSELDGALMTASCAAVIGFARAAATDMPLAANLSMALLAWYAWYENRQRRWLVAAYAFVGLATLAKGPVAAGFFALIVLIYGAARRDWKLLAETLWLPGIATYLVVTLPWFVAVELKNHEFFRVFILEHNFARFGTNLYRHQQPFWYFLPVALIGLLPWTIFASAAIAETVRGWFSEGRKIFESEHAFESDDGFEVFLLLWFAIPIVFFSFSQSKLPGYILPALPAAPMLIASYVRRRASSNEGTNMATLVLHALLTGIVVMPCLLMSYLVLVHRLPWGRGTLVAGIFSLLVAIGVFISLRGKFGLRLLHFSTLVPVVIAVAAIIRLGGDALDQQNSARPIATTLAQREAILGEGSPLPVAVFDVPRQTEYGLNFYRNQPSSSYDRGEIPAGVHLLVAREGAQSDLAKFIGSRVVTPIGSIPAQHLEYYRVSSAH